MNLQTKITVAAPDFLIDYIYIIVNRAQPCGGNRIIQSLVTSTSVVCSATSSAMM